MATLNLGQYPGLCGAHFVGSINTISDEAYFPPYKDVDLHLGDVERAHAFSVKVWKPTNLFKMCLEWQNAWLALPQSHS